MPADRMMMLSPVTLPQLGDGRLHITLQDPEGQRGLWRFHPLPNITAYELAKLVDLLETRDIERIFRRECPGLLSHFEYVGAAAGD